MEENRKKEKKNAIDVRIGLQPIYCSCGDELELRASACVRGVAG